MITCQRHEFGDIMAVLNKKCSRLVGVGLTRIHIAISLAIPPLSSPFMVHSMQIAVFKMNHVSLHCYTSDLASYRSCTRKSGIVFFRFHLV